MLTKINLNDRPNIDLLSKQILKDIETAPDVTDEEIEIELEENYLLANLELLNLPYDHNNEAQMALQIKGRGKEIWKKIQDIVCKGLTIDAVQSAIVNVVLGAVATVMPLGAVALKIVTWICRRLIKKGVDSMCAIN